MICAAARARSAPDPRPRDRSARIRYNRKVTETPSEANSVFEVDTATGPIVGSDRGQGPTLLFLHGGPGLSDYADLLAPELGGWRVVHYQQRGLPPSTVDGPFTVEQQVADAIGVLDARGLQRVVVVGHSWGAHLSLELAVAHPERVAGLVLIDGPGVTGDGGLGAMGQALMDRILPGARGQLEELAERMTADGPTDDDATEQLALLWPGYFADPATAPPSPSWMRTSVAANVASVGSMFEHLAAGFAESVAGITVPAIFVLGEQSPIPVTQGEQAAALIPSAEVRVMPAAGHLPWVEHPGCVADALADIQAMMADPEASVG
jgi:proline iminopeptidase